MKNTKKNEDVTVVVTCYNVENYITKCFDSILSQTYPNIKIIAVDDHSTDKTKKIIGQYAKKYKNFSAIYNKSNHGQGYSRNVGIKETKTKYIAFVDSDDWIESNFINELYLAITTNKADLAVCDIFVRHENPVSDYRVVMYDTKPDRYGLINTGLAASSCNKMIKTDLIKPIPYPENLANDDIQVVLALMYKYKTAYTDKTYYNYYQRPGSTQNGEVSSKRFEVFKSIQNLRDNINEDIDELVWDAIVWHQVIIVLLVVVPKASGILNRRRLVKDFHKLAIDNSVDIQKNQGFMRFMELGKLNKIYGSIIKFTMSKKLFTLASITMSIYFFCLRHKNKIKLGIKIVRLPIKFMKDPRGVTNRAKSIIKRKYVLDPKITIESVVVAAKKQQKMKTNNLVSVVIPNYNYRNFLIERVYSIVNQSRKIGEIIILDDNSTDSSVELAEEIQQAIDKYIPVRLINNKVNQGTFKQWSRGFSEAKYDYIWIAEADDFSHKDFLVCALKPFSIDPDIVLSYVDTGFMDARGLFIESARRHIDYQVSGHWDSDYIIDGIEEIRRYSYLNNTIANVSSVVFRKHPNIDYADILKDSMGYKQAGDWVFYTNCMLNGKIAYTNKTYNYYRMHGSNVSASTKAKIHLEEILKIYEMIDNRIGLTLKQKRLQEKRIKLLKKVWNVSDA